MKYKLLDLLVCPECKNKLELEVTNENNGEVETGFLHCRNDGKKYPIKEYVPRFVETDKYVDSFSFLRKQTRKHFDEYKSDRQGYKRFLPTTGFNEDDIKKGISLEIGCGYGRFLDVVDNMGGEIVGIELSTDSVELAQDFVGLREKVHIVQADLFNIPFKECTFDRVFSIGVLHHTPSTKEAFKAIVPYVKRQSEIIIWVYPPEMKTAEDVWRKITVKLPHRILFTWCIINQALFSWIRYIPVLGWRFSNIIPGCAKPNFSFWMRVISDFDGFAPQYAFSHTPEEVVEWFEEFGLQAIKVLPRRTSVKAIKPSEI